MKFGLLYAVIHAITALGLASCGEDPELVRKNERQKSEIAKLKSEIASIQAAQEKMPPDLQEQINQAGKQQEKQAAEIGRLEAEVSAMTKRERELRREYEAYQAKYRLNQP